MSASNALALRPATAPAKKPRRKGLVIASITVMSVRNLRNLKKGKYDRAAGQLAEAILRARQALELLVKAEEFEGTSAALIALTSIRGGSR